VSSMKLQLPKHVAFILDGNRRFGKLVMGDRLAGHRFGSDKVLEVLRWCQEYDIREVTMWVFSTENFNRPEKEVSLIMQLFIEKLKAVVNNKDIHKQEVRINFCGRTDLFPQKVQQSMSQVVDATKGYSKFVVNMAVGYGGHQEILDVAKSLARKAVAGELSPDQIASKDFEAAMYLDLPDIDLIIRTGGVRRTSGFMPWKGAYAEWYFTEKFWPELDKTDFIRALTDYSERKRRFGK
jgi:undecaprenyl diphosphate synthase